MTTEEQRNMPDVRTFTPEELEALRRFIRFHAPSMQHAATTDAEVARGAALPESVIRWARRRRHRLEPGQCAECDKYRGGIAPPHDASLRCESMWRDHCSCGVCF